MFRRYASLVVVGLVVISAGQIVEAGRFAGQAFWHDEAKTDFVTNTEVRTKNLLVISNESDEIFLNFDFEHGFWGVVNRKPLNDWFRDLMREKEATVLYRGNEMESAVSVDLTKHQISKVGLVLQSKNMNHGRQILSSQKVGVRVCGENYTFDLTHPNVAKGRDAMTRVLSQK